MGRVLGSFLLLAGRNQMALADIDDRDRIVVADAKRLSGQGSMPRCMLPLQFHAVLAILRIDRMKKMEYDMGDRSPKEEK